MVGVDLLPGEPSDFAQRFDDLAQFAGIKSEQLLLKIPEIQVQADASGHTRLTGRLAERFSSSSSLVSERFVFLTHSSARRN